MNNLYFGKIPSSWDAKQFENGYVIANKAWFNGLNVGDYAFVGSSGTIALWKAKSEEKVKKNEIKISFEIIDGDLGFNTKKFRNLKGLILNPQLVFTQRQSKNKGFFELKLQDDFTVQDFIKKSYYTNDENFRKIKVLKNLKDVNKKSDDIQLYLDKGFLQLYKASFISEQSYADFNDYRFEANGAHPDKDKTFDIISNAITSNIEEISYDQLTIADLYDAFFCEYKVNYWLIAPGENLIEAWKKSLQNGQISVGWGWTGDLSNFKNEQTFVTKFKKQFEKDDNRSANDVWKYYNKMKIGDIVFAKNGMSKIFGMGIVTSDYYYDDSEDKEYSHIHDVEWKVTKLFDYDHGIRKTITQLKKSQGENIMAAMNEQINEPLIDLKNLLLTSKNIILHGAPGTGKTYTAKDIAAQLICGTTYDVVDKDDSLRKKFNNQTEFVQFHPSYDYSDFVEGLRPIEGDVEGDVGFERKDGVFKSFCERALRVNKNLSVDNFDEALKKMLEDLEGAENGIEIPLLTGNDTFRIALNSSKNGFVTLIPKKDNEKEFEKDNSRFFNFNQCHRVYQNKPGYLSGGTGHDNYRKAIVKELKNHYGLLDYVEGTPNEEKSNIPFVFIIDEINRGEMSKIFGELFYSIDPDYRGTKGKVRTQYANMMKKKNNFDEVLCVENSFGNFFIPENVYIIGTMNDIDRSVDSMDFAMRRRFTFIELKANKCLGMLRDIQCSDNEIILVDEIIAKMNCLNDAIYNETDHKGIPGLSSSYHIGGSYFSKLEKYTDKTKEEAINALWNNHLRPLLNDYMRGLPNLTLKLDELEKKYKLAGIIVQESEKKS